MAEPDPPPEDDALSSLRRRVSAAQGQGASSSEPPPSAASLALKMGGEFGAAVIVGAAIGFAIDHLVHSSPIGLGVGVMLGFAAGVLNVVRAAKTYSSEHPVDPEAPSIPDDEDD